VCCAEWRLFVESLEVFQPTAVDVSELAGIDVARAPLSALWLFVFVAHP